MACLLFISCSWPPFFKQNTQNPSKIIIVPTEDKSVYVAKLKTIWPVPSYWQEQEPDPIGKAKFLISNGIDEAIFTIVRLEGDSGSLLANINRWRKQLFLKPITKNELPNQVDELILGKKRIYITKQISASKSSLIAIYKPALDISYFIKLSGSPILVTNETQAFLDFLKEVKFN